MNGLEDKEGLARKLYLHFNTKAFNNKLPMDLPIKWSIRLNKTAGRTHTKRLVSQTDSVEYHAEIELATKVLDTHERLQITLLHEMCHAACWLLDHDNSQPHGKLFKKWGQIASDATGIEVTTCHSYDIAYKYTYRCSNAACGRSYGRHSKSINIETHGCGYCKHKLILVT